MKNLNDIKDAIREEIQSWYDTYGEYTKSIDFAMPNGIAVYSEDLTYYLNNVQVSNVLINTEYEEVNIGEITVPFEEAEPVDIRGEYSCYEEFKFHHPFAI